MALRIALVLLIIPIVVGCAGSPKYQPKPPSEFYMPKEIVKAQKRVLLIGPALFDNKSSKDIKAIWQKEIIAKWAKFRTDSRLFELIPLGENHKPIFDKLISKEGLNNSDLILLRSKTGSAIDAEKGEDERIKTVFRTISNETGVDAVMNVVFVFRTAPVQYNRAIWDGRIEDILDKSALKSVLHFWNRAVGPAAGVPAIDLSKMLFVFGKEDTSYHEGEIPVISLLLQIIDKKGNLLYEGIGGYKTLLRVREGIFSNDIQNLMAEDIFNEEYKDDRVKAIELVLKPLKSL